MCYQEDRGSALLLLVGLVCLFLASLPAHGQEAELPEPSTVSMTLPPLSSYTTSELWSLYYTTLTRLEAQSQTDRLALTSYVESATSREQSLTLTIEGLQSALTTATQALASSEQSAQSLSDAGQEALDLARRRLIEARVAEAALFIALGGLAASLIW